MVNSPYDVLIHRASEDWSSRAACLDLSPKDFGRPDNEGVYHFLKRMEKRGETLSCPRSCPVMAQCALDALIHKDIDVIRAGVYIFPQNPWSTAKSRTRLKEIAEPLMDDRMRKIVETRHPKREAREWAMERVRSFV